MERQAESSSVRAEKVRVLLVEDDPETAQLYTLMLSGPAEPAFSVECAGDLGSALRRLKESPYEVVLLDLLLPDSRGLDTVSRVHEQDPKVPIVVLTSVADQSLSFEAVKRGAQDYLVKAGVDAKILARVIHYAIERKHAEQEAKTRESRIQTDELLSSIPSILIGVNTAGFVMHWNRIAEQTFDVPAAVVIGRPLLECNIPWDFARVLEAIRNCQKQGRPVPLDDVPFKRTDGIDGLLGFSVLPLKSDPVSIGEVLLFGADVTERRRLQQLKDEFVTAVSHELRTPMAIIREGIAQIYEGIHGEVTEEQKRFLSLSLDSMDRLRRIVDQLLDISKIEAGKIVLNRELLDLVNLVKGIRAGFLERARRKGLEIALESNKGNLAIYADRDKLTQVFLNLVDNAVKWTDEGKVQISLVDKDTVVECSVSDSGKGIAPENLPKLFNRFEQFGRGIGFSEKGSGLGLVLCKGLVELHQGKIWVESAPGKGAKFTFHLPKFTSRQLGRECLERGLRKAIQDDAGLSVLIFDMVNIGRLERRIGREKTVSLMHHLGLRLQEMLRAGDDRIIEDRGRILAVCPQVSQEDTRQLVERIQEGLNDYWSQQGLRKEIVVASSVLNFPEDTRTEEEFLRRVFPE